MSYGEHLRFSLWIAMRLLVGAGHAALHAVFPPIFSASSTTLVLELNTAIKTAGCR